MTKPFAKNILLLLLLTILSNPVVNAEVKNYQYDGKLPFVQMMLNMMVVMGILDRVPTNGRYGGAGAYGNSRFPNSPWSASNFGGLNGGGLDSAPWGSPTWGVLPPESYALDGWVNESWETSPWNSRRQLTAPNNTAANNNAIAQNAPTQQHQNPAQQQNNAEQPRPSPLAKLVQPNQAPQNDARQYPQRSYNRSQQTTKQKPCITDYCGLQKPNLNGLWVSQNGEMLGIKNKSYLWSDGASRYLTGKLKTQNEFLLASVDGHKQLMRFKYKLSGNYLLTMQPGGEVREFTRMSQQQYQNYNQGYMQIPNQSPVNNYNRSYN